MFPSLKWLPFALAGAAGFGFAWLIHLTILAGVERAGVQALTEQRATLEAQCTADKAVTERANNDLQADYAAIARKLAHAQRLRPSRCVVPTADATVPPSGGGEHAGQNGISTGWLREFAAECEAYRAERMTLESFLDAERGK